MPAQDIPCVGPAMLTVRTELKDSTLRKLHEGAQQYADGEDAIRQLSVLFASLADQVRADESIDLTPYSTTHEAENAAMGFYGYRVGAQLVLEISYAFEHVGSDNWESTDWRYLSDLAALAADIDAAMLEPA